MKLQPTLATLLLLGLAAVPAFAAFDTHYDQGDIILGMMATGVTSNVEANLGSVLTLQSYTTTTLLGNAGSAFIGLNGTWYDSSSFVFGVANSNNASGTNPGTADAAGDFNNTVYVTKARGTGSSGGTVGTANSTAWPLPNGSITLAASDMIQMGATFADQGGLSSGVLTVTNATLNDWADYNNSGSGSTQSWQAFTGTNNTNFKFATGGYAGTGFTLAAGLTNIEGVVDVYRLPKFANGSSSSADGTATYFGSVALNQTGDVYWIPATVPEPGSALLLVAAAPLVGGFLRLRRPTVTA